MHSSILTMQSISPKQRVVNFFKSPQVANPQILDLILLSQIRKFLNYACPHVANPQIFMNNQHINKFLQNSAQLCHERSLKVGFLKLIKILLKLSAVYAIRI
jgi:hypothetical protein